MSIEGRSLSRSGTP